MFSVRRVEERAGVDGREEWGSGWDSRKTRGIGFQGQGSKYPTISTISVRSMESQKIVTSVVKDVRFTKIVGPHQPAA